MKTLTQIQDEALRRLNGTRSSERRYIKLCGSVHRWYIAEIAKIGVVDTSENKYLAQATWIDVLNMNALRKACEEAA